jgi:hypothetical protein
MVNHRDCCEYPVENIKLNLKLLRCNAVVLLHVLDLLNLMVIFIVID